MPCIRLACCGTRGTSEKPSVHKNDDLEIAALVFTLLKVTCRGIVKTYLKKKAQAKTSRQQKTNLVVKYSSSSESSNPTVVNTNCCISPEKHPTKFLSSRANCCTCCSCFHSVYFDTLCIHLTCCGTLGASEESSAHTSGSFKIAALVFRFAERRHAVASPRLVRKRRK